MVRNRAILFFLFFCVSFQGFSQSRKHLVYFTDKSNTPYSALHPEDFLSERAIERRFLYEIAITEEDLPVNPAYIEGVNATGATVIYSSKWFNACLVQATEDQLSEINSLPYVKNLERVKRDKRMQLEPKPVQTESEGFVKSVSGTDNSAFGNTYNQVAMMNVDKMHRDGFKGDGIVIAVMDAGFNNVNQLDFFSHLYQNNKILGTYDFVDNEINVYDDHSHGTHVLSLIAAFKEGEIIGTSYESGFYLFRTEDVASEFQIEEVNWLIAAEYADSAGVDIIQTSLGYNTFDEPAMNYSYSDLNGQTSIISIASNIAFSKGIFLVSSAGNEGNKAWRYVTMPADSDNVLTVGAVNSQGNYAAFSSIGPTADGRIKPDVVAQGALVYLGHVSGNVTTGNGTSYSAPLVTGLVAGLWQSCREVSNQELLEVVRASGHQAGQPNNRLGYGIPNYIKARNMLKGLDDDEQVQAIAAGPNPFGYEDFTVYIPAKESHTVSIYVYDVKGVKVDEFSGMAEEPYTSFRINSAAWSPGMYMVQVVSGTKRRLFKMVKVTN
ncbi:MAG: S8 family serine peptidase [Cytophagaceae bacterium]